MPADNVADFLARRSDVCTLRRNHENCYPRSPCADDREPHREPFSQEPRNGTCPPKLNPQGEHSRVPGTIWSMLAAIGVGTELPP
jgi:hypothetical protein